MKDKYLLGIDVGGTSVKMALFSLSGEIIKKWSISTDKEDNGKYIPNHIESSVKEELLEEDLSLSDLGGIGLGIPGFVDIEKGKVEWAVNIGWRDFPLASLLSERLQTPVFIDNDANLAAAGEYWKGAGESADDMICFTIGTGVGGGLLVNGQIVHGIDGMAGEVGHITVDPIFGKPCNCGKKGCLETVSSATGMVNLVIDRLEEHPHSLLHEQKKREITTKDIFQAAQQGDRLAKQVIEESAFYLGLAIANACNLFNPKKVVIGGGVSAAGDAWLQPLQQSFDRFALEKVRKGTTFAIAELGNDAGVIGAAWLAAKSMEKSRIIELNR